jgi:EAL domain-containing protein (putative c-di-GMP-specific phosphodiesterase class I)
VHLAQTLELSVVAEGVETIEQLRQVRELGFRFIQGFYFSPARPLSEILLML